MAIKQTIKYNSENKYFAGFLQNIIDEVNIKGSVSFSNNEIELLLDDKDTTKLEEFSILSQKYLPRSIFLSHIQTNTTDDEIIPSKFESDDYDIAPCPKCLEMINNPSNENYLNESLKCSHYSNKATTEYYDNTIFSPHYSNGCAVLVTNPQKIDDLFIVTQDEIEALFSIEKPTIKVTIKDETLKELTGKKFINIKLPYNIKSTLASINAKESDIDYMFFYDTSDLYSVVVQKNLSIIYASRVAKQLDNLDENPVINRFLNIMDEAKYKNNAIGTNLSTHGISFIVKNEIGVKEVLRFQTFDLEIVLSNFAKDEKRTKLIKNFEAKFPSIYNNLKKESLGLFETISIILELDFNTFDALCDKSYEFRGNGGLKIDTYFYDDGFDYEAFIGSIISFKLAGVDMHYLAYSIFEAIADMSITVMNQLQTKFKIDKYIMMGDMFSNNVLYSRILSKFQLSNPYFSKSIALDTLQN